MINSEYTILVDAETATFSPLNQELTDLVEQDSVRIEELRQCFIDARQAVERGLTGEDINQLKDFSRSLVENFDEEALESCKELVEELHSNNKVCRLQGSLSELWTFQDSSDVDVALRYTYGSVYGVVPTNDNGIFEVYEPGHSKRIFQTKLQKILLLTFLAFNFISLIELIIFVPTFLTSFLKMFITINSTTTASIDTSISALQFYFYLVAVFNISLFLQCAMACWILKYMYNLSVDKKFFCNFVAQRWKHGPAFTDQVVNFKREDDDMPHVSRSVDWVPCVLPDTRMTFDMSEWKRLHESKFGKVSLQHVEGCKVGMVRFADPLWRWSFSEFEGAIVRNLNIAEGMTIALLKILCRQSAPGKATIGSYPVKTAFFWCRYFLPTECWTTSKVGENTLIAYCFLLNCFTKEYLGNYFLPSENIVIRHKVSGGLSNFDEILGFLTDNFQFYLSMDFPCGIKTAKVILDNWSMNMSKTTEKAAAVPDYLTCVQKHRQYIYRLNSFFFFWFFLLMTLLSIGAFFSVVFIFIYNYVVVIILSSVIGIIANTAIFGVFYTGVMSCCCHRICF